MRGTNVRAPYSGPQKLTPHASVPVDQSLAQRPEAPGPSADVLQESAHPICCVGPMQLREVNSGAAESAVHVSSRHGPFSIGNSAHNPPISARSVPDRKSRVASRGMRNRCGGWANSYRCSSWQTPSRFVPSLWWQPALGSRCWDGPVRLDGSHCQRTRQGRVYSSNIGWR
jgi:hypothetical protein